MEFTTCDNNENRTLPNLESLTIDSMFHPNDTQKDKVSSKPKRLPKENTSRFYSAVEVAELLGVSKSGAYRVIKLLNEQLSAKGYLTLPGRISKRFFEEMAYF